MNLAFGTTASRMKVSCKTDVGVYVPRLIELIPEVQWESLVVVVGVAPVCYTVNGGLNGYRVLRQTRLKCILHERHAGWIWWWLGRGVVCESS